MYKARNIEKWLVLAIILIVVFMAGTVVKSFMVEAWDIVEKLDTRTNEIEEMFETIDGWDD